MRAVRACQERYRPKVVTLGLRLIESRILFVLNDLSGLTAEEFIVHLNTQINEALFSLSDRGMLTADRDRYTLTELGKSKADEIWSVAEAHAKETFKRFSPEELDTFTNVLRQLIND